MSYEHASPKANSSYSFIKSIFEKVAESLEQDALVKIEEADDVSSAELEAKLRSGLLHLRSEENMQLRMMLSHPYNIENILRTMATTAEIQRLRQALVEKGRKRTVLQQLFEDEKLVAELKPYRSGVEMMKKCAEGALGGQFDFDICLNMIQIEREAKKSNCAACAETPEMAVKATKVCPKTRESARSPVADVCSAAISIVTTAT